MSRQVNPVPKIRGDCVCGCGLVGVLRPNGHARRCACRPCQGGRNRRKGVERQRAFQRAAGIRGAAHRGANGNEENWRDTLVWEHKADARHARPVVTAYRLMVTQIRRSQAIGDVRRPACGVTYDGTQLVVLDAETWQSLIVPALDALEAP